MKDEGYKNISRATHPPESQQKQKRREPVTPFGLPLFWDAPAPRPDGSLINEGTKKPTTPQQRPTSLTDALLHLFQEWKEDHLSQSNYIDAIEQIKAAHGIAPQGSQA